LSNWAQLRVFLKSCVCSLKWAQVEINRSIRLGDIRFRSYLLYMQKADNGLFQASILTWSCIEIRSAKHLNFFWTLIVNPNSVQNRHKNQSILNFNPTCRYDTCAWLSRKWEHFQPFPFFLNCIPDSFQCLLEAKALRVMFSERAGNPHLMP